jgi:hypothetical protein
LYGDHGALGGLGDDDHICHPKDGYNQATANTRFPKSGFYQHDSGTTTDGWPITDNTWWHLINCQHTNLANNYALQFAASFYDTNKTYIRVTNNNGAAAWKKLLHGGNAVAPMQVIIDSGEEAIAVGRTVDFFVDFDCKCLYWTTIADAAPASGGCMFFIKKCVRSSGGTPARIDTGGNQWGPFVYDGYGTGRTNQYSPSACGWSTDVFSAGDWVQLECRYNDSATKRMAISFCMERT